jgi:hypothetical protein
MVVATSVTTIKHLTLVQTKQIRYEDVYRAIINIKDYIDADICQKKRSMHGRLNDFEYKVECRQEVAKRKYQKAFEIGDSEGNIGNVMAILSKVVITLKKDNFTKEYSYQKLTTKRVF